MKVTFIRPAMMVGVPRDSLEPLVFAILSGLTPSDIERVFYDQRIESVPFEEPTDLVAMSVDTFTARSAYQIADRYRRKGVPVVMGGHHPTLMPDEAIEFASSIVIGDAEEVWYDVLTDARSHTLKRTYKKPFADFRSVDPDRGIFRGKKYQRMALVQFGRGCRFACDFCSVHAFYGSILRHRPVDEVVREIRHLKTKRLFFVDDNLFAQPDAARKLLDALPPLGIRWACQVSIDIADNEETVRAMARSGCMAVILGLESLNGENLEQMSKAWNSLHDYERSINVFRRNGIMVYGTFIFGYDGDTRESFRPTVEFAIRQKLMTANFNPLAPTPGTPLYERLRQEGLLIYDRWWLHPDFRYGQSFLYPKRMSPEELASGCLWARRRFNSFISIARRGLDLQANCRSFSNAGVYAAINWITRSEIERKQWQSLGSMTEAGLSEVG